MSPEAGATTVVLVGVLQIRLVLSDAYLRYVQPALAPWLLLAGAALVLLGGAALLRAWRTPVPAAPLPVPDATAHGHAHAHTDRTGWLLLVPVLAVLLAPPPALGSFGVARGVTVTGGGRTFAALAADGNPRAMTIAEFDQRSADAAGASFAGQPVELTGFVADPAATDPASSDPTSSDPAPTSSSGTDPGYRLARFQISCCAADAVAAVVRVHEPSSTPHGRDTWVTVVGTFRGVGPDGTPELDALATHEVAAPVDPYE